MLRVPQTLQLTTGAGTGQRASHAVLRPRTQQGPRPPGWDTKGPPSVTSENRLEPLLDILEIYVETDRVPIRGKAQNSPGPRSTETRSPAGSARAATGKIGFQQAATSRAVSRGSTWDLVWSLVTHKGPRGMPR